MSDNERIAELEAHLKERMAAIEVRLDRIDDILIGLAKMNREVWISQQAKNIPDFWYDWL